MRTLALEPGSYAKSTPQVSWPAICIVTVFVLSPRMAYTGSTYLTLSERQEETRSRIIEQIATGAYQMESVACFCGTTDDLEIAGRDRYGLPVQTWLCRACGLLRSSPRLDAASSEKFYSEHYRELYAPVDTGAAGLFDLQVAHGRQLRSLLAQLLPDVESVFEVGCGAGGNLQPFAEIGKRVAGVDLGNNDYLEHGRERGLDLVSGGADRLRADRGQADLVLCVHVLEHFRDLRAEIALLESLVAPGGFLLIEVPGLRRVATTYRNDLMLYLQNAHNHHFTARTMSMVLSACGLHVCYADDTIRCLCVRAQELGPDARDDANAAPDPLESARVQDFLNRQEAVFLDASRSTGTGG